MPLRMAVVALGLLTPLARAGNPPELTAVWPPGASVGADTVWTFTGRNLDRVSSVVVSGGSGVEVVDLRHDRPDQLHATARVRPDAPVGWREVRLDGPDGASGLVRVRVDPLPQREEASLANRVILVGSAVAGRLEGSERDRYQVRGDPGQRVWVDLEAHRLGSRFAPVVTATTAGGRSLGQARGSRGATGVDPRLVVLVPAEGWFLVEVRDNLDRAGDRSAYRLRVEPEAGGDPPQPPLPLTNLEPGHAVEGVIGVAGRVVTYRLAVASGGSARVRVAAGADSPLDPVVTVRDESGAFLAEGDDTDEVIPGQPAPVRSRDCRVEVGPLPHAGLIVIEVADRFGRGGPDFAYRVEAGPPAPDFRLVVRAGPSGVVGIRPETEAAMDVAVVPEGFAGSVEIRAEGLPAGVRVEPTTVRVPGVDRLRGGSVAARVWVEVDASARPGFHEFTLEVVAGSTRRVGVATVEGWGGPGSSRTVERVGLRVLGP